jgi:hypothetical protein
VLSLSLAEHTFGALSNTHSLFFSVLFLANDIEANQEHKGKEEVIGRENTNRPLVKGQVGYASDVSSLDSAMDSDRRYSERAGSEGAAGTR